jgi:PKD repeat protein
MCIEPMSRVNGTFTSSQEQIVSKYSSARNAISFKPDTPQFRAAYNSVAYERNYNLQLSYKTYVDSINTLNRTANCDVNPSYKKYSYVNMLNSAYSYVSYIEGSGLYDY